MEDGSINLMLSSYKVYILLWVLVELTERIYGHSSKENVKGRTTGDNMKEELLKRACREIVEIRGVCIYSSTVAHRCL